MNPEAIEAAARAMAILDDYDGCFLEVDQWEGQEDWEKQAHPDNYPGMAYEDCEYWRGKASAALEAAAPYLIREARADDGREELAKVLGDHYGTSAGGDDYLWAMADILIGRGFGKVREARAAELEAAAMDAGSLNSAEFVEWGGYMSRWDLVRIDRWLRDRASAVRAGQV